jgi:hypothetical protein
MKLGIGVFAILFLLSAPGFPVEPPRDGKEAPPIRMEDLEVRGLRERPEVLYLPVHRGITLPSPVRYDLFLEDMVFPVFPGEISPSGQHVDKPVPARSAP